MSEELKPCPFCGCADCQSWEPSQNGFYVVQCTRCRARTGQMSPESAAITAWNTRQEKEA